MSSCPAVLTELPVLASLLPTGRPGLHIYCLASPQAQGMAVSAAKCCLHYDTLILGQILNQHLELPVGLPLDSVGPTEHMPNSL